jgi:ethanolamine utilization protein EutA
VSNVSVSNSQGGRIFFSNRGRKLSEEDQISVLTVGVDVGSSTSHLVFSRIVMERMDSRYVVASRETLFESAILLTPYADGETIDAAALGEFIEGQYRQAGIDPDKVDTGALILTGVAAGRSNARRIGELFARQAGKMVAVSAGDSLEAVMAAHGSGAVARSVRQNGAVMNIDVGGGTSKIALCIDGQVTGRTAVDVGARLISTDPSGRIVRIEDAARLFIRELGLRTEVGEMLDPSTARALAQVMAERLMTAVQGGASEAGGVSLMRLDPLPASGRVDCVTVSGGVSEYFYGGESATFGDLGPALALALRERIERWGPRIESPAQRIRATVIGASQYTTQVSGSTIYVSPVEILPLRNVPVIAPSLDFDSELIDRVAVCREIQRVLKRQDLTQAGGPVAIYVKWRGSVTFARLDAFCKGVVDGTAEILRQGHPIVLACDGDVGGLTGIHFHEEMGISYPVVSIDSLELREFDFIDVGQILDMTGAVSVVIKSLIFPAEETHK